MNVFLKSKEKSWHIFNKYYPNYTVDVEEQKYTELIRKYLNKKMIVLDAGCGRTFKYRDKLQDKVDKIIGIDLVKFNCSEDVLNGSLYQIPFKNKSFDLIISKSVLEHLENPTLAFKEFNRILRKHGLVIILTPNLYDYASLIAKYVPNKLHNFILERMLNRKPESVFDTYFRMNTKKKLYSIAKRTGFRFESINYVSQYPHYLMFNTILFRMGIMYEKMISRFKILGFLRPWILGVLRKVE